MLSRICIHFFSEPFDECHIIYDQLKEAAQLCPTLYTLDCSPSFLMWPSMQEYCSGLPFLLQDVFWHRVWTQVVPHCKQITYFLSHQGSLWPITPKYFSMYFCKNRLYMTTQTVIKSVNLILMVIYDLPSYSNFVNWPIMSFIAWSSHNISSLRSCIYLMVMSLCLRCFHRLCLFTYWCSMSTVPLSSLFLQ